MSLARDLDALTAIPSVGPSPQRIIPLPSFLRDIRIYEQLEEFMLTHPDIFGEDS